jgi:hypothetical protein
MSDGKNPRDSKPMEAAADQSLSFDRNRALPKRKIGFRSRRRKTLARNLAPSEVYSLHGRPLTPGWALSLETSQSPECINGVCDQHPYTVHYILV